jgi:hypothetical protein
MARVLTVSPETARGVPRLPIAAVKRQTGGAVPGWREPVPTNTQVAVLLLAGCRCAGGVAPNPDARSRRVSSNTRFSRRLNAGHAKTGHTARSPRLEEAQ